MSSLRAILIAFLTLSIPPTWVKAAEPPMGKLRLVHCLQNPNETLAARVFSTDGKLLIVGRSRGGSSYVRVWDPKLRKETARLSFGKEVTYPSTFSPDGKTVAVHSYYDHEHAIRLFDVASGKRTLCIPQPTEVIELTFTPDGQRLISVRDGIRLWDVKTGKEVWGLQLRLPQNDPCRLRETWDFRHTSAFSPDGKFLAVGLEDSSIHLCDMRTGREVRRLFRKGVSTIPQIAFSPHGRYLAAYAEEAVPEGVNSDGLEKNPSVIRLWDVHSGQLVRTFYQFRPSLSPKDRQNYRVFQPYNAKYQRHSRGLSFSPDGKTIVNCGWITQLWEVATGRLRYELDPSISGWGFFSPNGRLLAVYHATVKNQNVEEESIHLWDWRHPCLKQPATLIPRDIERLWRDLASGDAAVGYQAIATLLAHPKLAVAALRERLRRIEPLAPGEVNRLIVNLDDEAFTVREHAAERLAVLGEVTRSALLRAKAQRPSLEVRRRIQDLLPRLTPAGLPDRLRCLRAVEVLETVGTEEARQVIKRLASGAEGTVETEDAKAALQRLNQK